MEHSDCVEIKAETDEHCQLSSISFLQIVVEQPYCTEIKAEIDEQGKLSLLPFHGKSCQKLNQI